MSGQNDRGQLKKGRGQLKEGRGPAGEGKRGRPAPPYRASWSTEHTSCPIPSSEQDFFFFFFTKFIIVLLLLLYILHTYVSLSVNCQKLQ